MQKNPEFESTAGRWKKKTLKMKIKTFFSEREKERNSYQSVVKTITIMINYER